MKLQVLAAVAATVLGSTLWISLQQTPTPTVTAQAQEQTQEPEIQYFTDNSGLAIRGADPVAYFTEGQPVLGSAEFEYEWQGTTWRFSSAEHRDLFAAAPEDYAPQYGGFCAWAVSQGYTAPVDPNAWKIVDDKLYLNVNQRIQRRWESNISGHIAQADANWPGVLQ